MLGRPAIGRRNLRRAPHWLALLAMLLQFVASYGHLHRQDFNVLLHGYGTPILAAGDGTGGGTSDSLAADIDCPICASMQLLGSAALPDGVRLPVPAAQASMRVADIEALHLTPPHLLFDTHGPPLT